MKQMVNAFSEYARAPDMHFSRFDLNQLITEVVDLYRVQDERAELKLMLSRVCRRFRPTGSAFVRSSTTS